MQIRKDGLLQRLVDQMSTGREMQVRLQVHISDVILDI